MKLGVLVVSVCCIVTVSSQTDRTRQDGAYGSDVVEGVMSMLLDACIYPDTQLFLRRLAYTESQDGVNPITYSPGNNGGIWQVDKAKFDITHSQMSPELSDNIRDKLGINWAAVTWTDLRKPLFSGLAAAIFLMTKGAPDNVPPNMTDQGTYWTANYRPSGFSQTFVNFAKELDVGCTKEEKMDLLFLIDTAGPIFDSQHIKNFMKNYISSVDIGPKSVQVAVESFGTIPQVNLPLAFLPEKHSLLAAIDGITFTHGTPDLLEALQTASDTVFGPTSNVRSTVAKVIILVSSDRMNLTQAGLIESFKIKNKGVTIYTVGTGLSNNVLHELASLPVCSHSYTVTDYTSLENLHPAVAQTSCRVAVGLQIGQYTYPCGSNVLFRVESSSVGTSVKVTVDNGTADVYGSYVNSQPSKDVNNVNQTASAGQPVSFYIRDKRPLTVAVESERRHLVSCSGNIRIAVEPSVAKRSECQKRKPDIVLLLDSSHGKSQNDFKDMMDFASGFASRFDIGTDAAQISLVTYADKPVNQFWLKTYKRQEDIQNAIRSLPMTGTNSNLASALKFVREQTLTSYYGERKDSSKVLVVVTGNDPMNQMAAVVEAQLLKNLGVRIVVVATGPAAKDLAIQQVGSGSEHIQLLGGYSDMPKAVDTAVTESCGDVQLVCMENGLQRNCKIEDLLMSLFGSLIIPNHGAIPNSPCSIHLPVPLPIHRFPHPTDSDKFILCDNKGQSYLVLCPVREVFNGNTSECELHSAHPTNPPPTTTIASKLTTFANKQTTLASRQTTFGQVPVLITTSPPTQPPTSMVSPCTGASLSTGVYYHPYIPDSHKYIHCSGMPNASKLEDCDPLKVWRQESMQCEFEFLTDQNGQSIPSMHNPCISNHPAYFPHPTDKTAYIQCDAFGQGFVITCHAGTEYVVGKQACGVNNP